MPVNPLPENNTARLWVDYTSRGIGHRLMFRFPVGTDASAGVGTATDVIEALRPLMMTTDSFTGMSWSHAGSNLSFPLPFTAIGGTQLNASDENDPESFFFSWAGRGPATGRRYVPKFFGSRGAIGRPTDNRWSAGELAGQDAIRQVWQDAADPSLYNTPIVTIGLDTPIFNGYTNVASNSYWQRAQR